MARQVGIRSRINLPNIINDITNVYTPAPNSGQVLIFNSITDRWESGNVGFMDDFSQDEIFWGWIKDKTDANHLITQANGVLKFQVINNAQARFNPPNNTAPKVFTGIPGCPCEIITKLTSFSPDFYTGTGLFIGIDPVSVPLDNFVGICLMQLNNGGQTKTRIVDYTHEDGGVASANIDTIPIWFKIRLIQIGYLNTKIMFYYSEDGISYTHLYTTTDLHSITGVENAGLSTGLFVKNGSVMFSNLEAEFDFFHITPIASPDN